MTANKRSIGSNLVKADSYQNSAADYAEIPEISDEDFARAVPHRNGVPVRGRPLSGEHHKRQVTLRLDEDVIDYFRSQGAGWQTRINAALRGVIGC